MKRLAVVASLFVAIGVAVAAPTIGNLASPAPAQQAAPVENVVQPQQGDTPMAQRVATIGVLNKRNGIARDFVLKPGETAKMGDLVVRLKACETTADWEADQMTGAFVQVVVKGADTKWRRVFSGWLFKESPSLNVVEHPIYDVWTKACTMRHAEAGPDTVTVGDEGTGTPSHRSKARKSADGASASGEAPSADTDASSNPI